MSNRSSDSSAGTTTQRVLQETTAPASTGERAAQEPPREHQLVFVTSPDPEWAGRICVLDPEEDLILGRNPEGGMPIRDPKMSRTHFRLVHDPHSSQFRIGDGGSRNGTFVGGRRVQTALLGSPSVVRVGDTVFVYRTFDGMEQMRTHVEQYAPVTLAVFITGETGTGKEVVARQIHEKSRREGRFLAINCASLSKELIAAELFGHAKGAFSGATAARDGLFRAASGGTLFLDEIGDMPLELQPTLLRVLQEGVVRPVGSDQEVKVDVRVLSASHRDLTAMVQSDRFRADLYARLSQAKIHIPPLRQRPDTTLALVEELAAEIGVECVPTPDAVEALLTYPWPLNVRELQSVLLRYAASQHRETGALDLDFLYEHHPEMFIADDSATGAGEDSRRQLTEQDLARALKDSAGNVMAAAKSLGISRPKIYRLMKGWDIVPTDFRDS